MGGKAAPPPAPDYTPFIQGSQAVAASDARAAEMQYDLGVKQLEAQKHYADLAEARGNQYYQMSVDANKWARDQFNMVWPYAQDYMESQQALSNLAGENASEAVLAARENRRQATETYDRYMTEFVPREQQFVREAFDYRTPARMDQASAAAQADVAQAMDQQRAAREAQLRSYGIDPSQARYQGESALTGIGRAAAMAGAGTQARRAQELTGFGLEQQAIALGQKLPTIALGQIEAATGGASGGLQAGQVGGMGIGAANQVYGTGATAGGSPVGFGYLGNVYPGLSTTAAGLAQSGFSGGNTALGNQASALGVGANALNSLFSNQMSGYRAQAEAEGSMWRGIGSAIGGIGTAAIMRSDSRLKDDTKVVGHIGALPLHTFRYRDDPTRTRHLGFMADEVERIDPEAVITMPDGYKAVDYNRATISALEG